jgi:hypothetical protein
MIRFQFIERKHSESEKTNSTDDIYNLLRFSIPRLPLAPRFLCQWSGQPEKRPVSVTRTQKKKKGLGWKCTQDSA